MDKVLRERIDKLARRYNNTWTSCLENAHDMGFEPLSDEETVEAYHQLLDLVDAGEAD